MGEEEDLNVTLDALISKERRSRLPAGRGVGKRARETRGPPRDRRRRERRRSFGSPRERRSRRPGRRPRPRSYEEVGDADETWENDRYDERYGASARSKGRNKISTKAITARRRERDRDRDRDYDNDRSRDIMREPSSFTTRSGLQVSVGGNMMNPDLATSIQINGLHTNVSQADLWEILNKYGALKYVYIMYKEDGKTPSGSGRACFQQVADARKAVEDLRDATIDGVPIRITFLGDAGAELEGQRKSFRSRAAAVESEEEVEEGDGSRRRNRTYRRSQQINVKEEQY